MLITSQSPWSRTKPALDRAFRRGDPALLPSTMVPAPRPNDPPMRAGAWISLWIVALLSLLAQLWLCQFFFFGTRIPLSLDVDPGNMWKYAYQVPPSGEYLVLNWLGIANLPPPLNPFTLGTHLPPWLFFTTYTPVMATLALLAMAAFLRELEIPRPAALFGAVAYAWQGDLLTFIFPGHYGYIATWPFYALAAWGALRSQRIGNAGYALISGASCGIMVGLEPDRGGLASLLVAALYLVGAWKYRAVRARQIGHLALCAGVALVISLAAFFALFQSFIVGVSMGGQTSREETYKFDTQFSLGPEETLSYLVPGFFGWHSNSMDGPYWGRTGQWPGWPAKHEGMRNLNLAISTMGTVPTALALLGAALMLPGRVGRWFGADGLSERQLFFGRSLLALSGIALILAWGYHTPLYRLVFAVPLMDKWRNPLKWLEITNFAWITLSALGVQALIFPSRATDNSETPASRRPKRILLDALFLLLALGLALSYLLPATLEMQLRASDYDLSQIPAIIGTLHASLLVATVLMGFLCVLLRLAGRPERLRSFHLENAALDRLWKKMLLPERLPLTSALALAALGVVQLGWVATHFIRPTDIGLLTGANPLVDQLKTEGNAVRVSVAVQDPTLNFLLQNQMSVPQISCLDISAASRLPDALSAFLANFDDNPARLWLLAGVKSRVVPEAGFAALESDPRIKANLDHVDGYTLAPMPDPTLPSHALVQFRDYLAKATYIPGAEIVSSDRAQLARLRDPQWDPRATVLLSQGPHLEPPFHRPQCVPELHLVTYNEKEIEVQMVTREAGYLLINDAYDPDWQVEVNRHAAPLLRADYMLRAVAVPGGSSTVFLRYVAHYRPAGLSLPVEATNAFCDLFMLATWLAAGVMLRPRRQSASLVSGPVGDKL